jgi:hypothetical protein
LTTLTLMISLINGVQPLPHQQPLPRPNSHHHLETALHFPCPSIQHPLSFACVKLVFYPHATARAFGPDLLPLSPLQNELAPPQPPDLLTTLIPTPTYPDFLPNLTPTSPHLTMTLQGVPTACSENLLSTPPRSGSPCPNLASNYFAVLSQDADDKASPPKIPPFTQPTST